MTELKNDIRCSDNFLQESDGHKVKKQGVLTSLAMQNSKYTVVRAVCYDGMILRRDIHSLQIGQDFTNAV